MSNKFFRVVLGHLDRVSLWWKHRDELPNYWRDDEDFWGSRSLREHSLYNPEVREREREELLKQEKERQGRYDVWLESNKSRLDDLYRACVDARSEKIEVGYGDNGMYRKVQAQYDKLWLEKYGDEQKVRRQAYAAAYAAYLALVKEGHEIKTGRVNDPSFVNIDIKDGSPKQVYDAELHHRAVKLAYPSKYGDVVDEDWQSYNSTRGQEGDQDDTPPSWGDWVKPKGKR